MAATPALKEILVMGGRALRECPCVRVLTRDPHSLRARQLALLENVILAQGSQDNEEDLHRAFKGVYVAWVNLDCFALGEMKELYFAFRTYEIARHERAQHYVWANCDYALRIAVWDEAYQWGHNDAEGRVVDFILAHDHTTMKATALTVGPYRDMLLDQMLAPSKEADGALAWENPSGNGKIPLMALEDVGLFVKWIFDHPEESNGINLEMATRQLLFSDIVSAFVKITGRKAVRKNMPLAEYLVKHEPYPIAPANWADTSGSGSTMSWRQNFTA